MKQKKIEHITLNLIVFGTIAIIGGETVYRQAIELADELCLTEIDNEAPQADAFFPAIDPQIWHKKSKEVHLADEKHLCSYSFVDYIKEL